MCGLAGLLAPPGTPDLHRDVAAMTAALVHRGPDSDGVWADAESGLALGHRRLSILDLSPAGAQPMTSAGGGLVIAFNGEIYNHLDLRERLGPRAWRGQSDTETLLACLEDWGVERTLVEANGMFAFALWDRAARRLTLARDRLGEKPLFWGWLGDTLLFGSELKALAAHPRWRGRVDRDALALQLRVGYVPAPRTIWQGVHELPPGTSLAFPARCAAGVCPEPRAYWSAWEVAAQPAREDLDDAAAIAELETRLGDAVSSQMISDVPLGAFLSGGIDSSAIVALMQARSSRPVRTFTIGFTESDYDESGHARAVAAHLGTDHTELRVTPADAMAVIPRLPEFYDEPFGDSSQIPTHLVCALARRHVTVCLSGDGGDELFGGYNRYFWGRSLWRRLGGVPVPMRALAGHLVRAVPPAAWDALGRRLPQRLRQPALGDRLHKLAAVVDAPDTDALYWRLVSQHRDPRSLVLGAAEPPGWAAAQASRFVATARGGDFTERMMLRDLVDYLPGDILTKVDRAAMATSLETRIPLLDHRLVAFAWSLPLHQKIRDGQGKWLLRQVLYRHVPRSLLERPKQGFGLPLDVWLRGPLRDWAQGLLDPARLRREGWLDADAVGRYWTQHLSGRRNWQHLLWNVLMFQAWQERWT